MLLSDRKWIKGFVFGWSGRKYLTIYRPQKKKKCGELTFTLYLNFKLSLPRYIYNLFLCLEVRPFRICIIHLRNLVISIFNGIRSPSATLFRYRKCICIYCHVNIKETIPSSLCCSCLYLIFDKPNPSETCCFTSLSCPACHCLLNTGYVVNPSLCAIHIYPAQPKQ